MGHWKAILLVIFAPSSLATTDISACTCIMPQTANDAYVGSPQIFLGRVVDIRPVLLRDLSESEQLYWKSGISEEEFPGDTPIYSDVYFQVQESFKGLDRRKKVKLRPTIGGCGYSFRQGRRYVVFGPHICSFTREAEESADMLRYLRRKVRGGHRSLLAVQLGSGSGASSAKAMGLKLSVEGPGIRRRIRPMAESRLGFDGLAPGSYRATLEVRGDYDFGPIEQSVELAAPIDYAEITFSLPETPSGGIALKISDAAGRHLPRMFVFLHREGWRSPGKLRTEDGLFRARNLPLGKYLVAFPLQGSGSGDVLFYPGVRSPEQAFEVEVAAGHVTRLPDWRLPIEIESALLEGVVLLPDGSPAAGAMVALKTDLFKFSAEAGKDGRFKISYYLPFRYQLLASARGEIAGQEKSFQLEQTPWPPQELHSGEIRLILQPQ